MTNEQVCAIARFETELNAMTVAEMAAARTTEDTPWQRALTACIAIGKDT